MTEATEQPRRSRRAEETRRARRMKPGDVVNPSVKLAVDQSKLDNRMTYRWVKDDPARVKHMERMDWDLVDDPEIKPDSTGAGTIPTVHGGIGENGKPYGMVLMSKYKDWYEEDQKAKRKPLEETDRAIKRGTAHQQAGESDLDQVTYTPGTNSIEVRTSR